jgi:hypothetical protein
VLIERFIVVINIPLGSIVICADLFAYFNFNVFLGYGVINTYYVFAHFLFLRFDFLVLNQNEGYGYLAMYCCQYLKMGIKNSISALKAKMELTKKIETDISFKSYLSGFYSDFKQTCDACTK